MKPAPSSETSARRRGAWTARLLVFVGLAAFGGWLLVPAAEDQPKPASETATPPSAPAVVQPADVAIAAVPLELPEGALPPILGEPRMDRIDYCDDRNWRRVDGLVREVRGDELIVDEGAWQEAGASTRAGLAGWASKCRLDGRALVVRAHGSGRELGAYDAAFGYEIFD